MIQAFIRLFYFSCYHNAGSFYLVWGISWLFLTYWIHFTKPQKPQNKTGLSSFFTHESNDPLSFKSWIPPPLCPRIPIEPIIKIVLPGLGIFAEMFLDFYPDENGVVKFRTIVYRVDFDEVRGQFINLDRLFHIAQYLAFLISGVVDLISLCTRLPRLTNKIFLCFAFYSEYLLFSYHIHGRKLFNVAVHSLLLYFIGSCALFSTLRLFNSSNLFINAGLAGSMILQGTNLCQAGWILYGERKFNPYSHENSKFMAALTTWHLIGTGFLMVLLYVMMRAILRCLGKLKDFDYRAIPTIDELPEKRCLMNDTTAIEMQDVEV